MLRKIIASTLLASLALSAFADTTLYVSLNSTGAKGIPTDPNKIPATMTIINPIIDGKVQNGQYEGACISHICKFTLPQVKQQLIIDRDNSNGTAGLGGGVTYDNVRYDYVNETTALTAQVDSSSNSATLNLVGKIDEDDKYMKDYYLSQR